MQKYWWKLRFGYGFSPAVNCPPQLIAPRSLFYARKERDINTYLKIIYVSN